MKNFVKYILICLIVYGISSCYPAKKLTVTGTPGTEIYEKSYFDYDKIATIGNDGKAKIKLTRGSFTPFLLAHDKQTSKITPFGVDYKYKSRGGELFLFGLLTCWMHTLFVVQPNDQLMNGYEYLKYQSISPNPNAPYANTGERREVANRTASSGLLSKASTSSSTSKLLRKDYSKQLQGEYIGNGKLLQKENVVETYRNMKVVMSSVDRNTMTVEILMDGNEAVFAPCDYNIKSQGNNNFVLTSKEDSSNKIIIKGNKINYNNPNVRIDGEKYNLQITANKTR